MSEAVAAAPARQSATAEPGAKPELRLQRKCACGQHTVAGGECAECRKQRLTTQRWSTLGPTPGAMLRNAGASVSGDAAGADLSTVRAQTPALRTAPRIQREDAGAPAQETAEATEETEPEAVESAPETESSHATPPDDAAGAPEGGASPESQSARPGAALLAEDDAANVPAGQMRKTEFLDQLQRAVCAEADQALAAAGRSTEGCPYIAKAFGRYRGQSAAQVESGLRRYAPETRNARTAAETIPILAARVRQGVERWVATGEISGVPDDAPVSIPTGGLGGLLGGVARGIGSLLFKADEGGARPADDPAAVHAELGDGRAMESGMRGRMERAFGRSFGGVRMHTDATAGRLSAEQNARAFTVGGHVAFAAGEYRPGTMAGDALIAHELAHTVQQGGGSSSVQAKTSSSAGYDALETDADRSAASVVASLWGDAKGARGEMAGRGGPSLRSGLRLQRCKSDPPKQEAAPAAAPPAATTVSIAEVNANTSPPGIQRIPPRKDTQVAVTVAGAAPTAVELSIAGSGGNNGTATIDGGATASVASTTTIKLRGVDQTAPGSAGGLRLVAQQNGVELARSNPFSVSSIPLDYTDTFVRLVTGDSRGFVVQDGWKSDSDTFADLDETEISEEVQYDGGTGIFAGESGSNSDYLKGNELTKDTHSWPASELTGAGTLVANQTCKYKDHRSGAVDIPMRNSGYIITRTTTVDARRKVWIETEKVGARATANGIASDAGVGNIKKKQRV